MRPHRLTVLAASGWVAAGVLTVLAGRAHHRAHRARAEQAVAMRLAVTDDLTGLANRRGWREQLRQRAAFPGVVLAIDIDRFKHVNDQFGHPAGNRVLVEVARRLRTAAGPGAIVARVGGDEFSVFLPIPGLVSKALAERHARRLAAELVIEAGVCVPIRVTSSVGGAVLRAVAHPAAALAAADTAMYAAKASRSPGTNVAPAA
ncbi:GGDEF domain-containing protein [Longispora urticae]